MTASKASWTILEVLQWTTARFQERGIGSPRLDAELLAAHAFGLTRVHLYTQFDRPLLDGEDAGGGLGEIAEDTDRPGLVPGRRPRRDPSRVDHVGVDGAKPGDDAPLDVQHASV